LDAYVGAATDHTEIPVGRGVCGSAVSENRNKVIADVREEENYLACSLETRSEIVVLIKKGDMILGQIDIDGHVVDRFRREEEEFLSEMAEILASKWQ
jgi:GAF domain-containing protein